MTPRDIVGRPAVLNGEERRIFTGSHGEYGWLTSTADYSGTLLRLCPEVVAGQYLAITSWDSGILRLTDEHVASGWRTSLGVGYSPRIEAAEQVPHQRDGIDDPGYDEWFVFAAPCDLGERVKGNIFVDAFAPAPGRVVPFVNWLAFFLHDSDPASEALLAMFWDQLLRLRPESYVACGRECLTLVSRNRKLVERVHGRLAALSCRCL